MRHAGGVASQTKSKSPFGASSPFGKVLLATGPEGLLAERAAEDVIAAARAEDAQVQVTRVDAAEMDAGTLAEITGSSLFAERSVAVITDVGALDAGLHDRLAALVADPPAEVCLVLLHAGGNKGKGLITKVKKAKPVTVDCAALKPRDLPQFVNGEARRHRVRIDAEATAELIDSVGHDARALAGAVAQLANDRLDADAGGRGYGTIDTELVRRYFAGRAEVTGFAIADAAIAGKTTEAMEQLRWALATGVAPVLLTSALAGGLRQLGKLIDDRSGMSDRDLASAIGVPPWKMRTLRQQARGWTPDGVMRAILAVSRCDAEVKGAADEPEFPLERCVLAITQARGRGRQA